MRKNLCATTADWTTLSEELDYVKAYLSIEETRFEEKLHIHYKIDESVLHQRIPPLTLQPLVENAVKYSMAGSGSHNVFISIQSHYENRVLIVDDEPYSQKEHRSIRLCR
ncbi:histidine kinase [Domibacillus indicus]|uniref:histidine kinase n=1 Tax=Domibacillus indicus TaxID=1437523 RepID=UPI0038B3DF90